MTLFRIGEIAAMYDVSVRAMRLYEKKGIIKPIQTDEETGYRYYSIDQVQQLGTLLELQAIGFTLNEIKIVLAGNITDKELVAMLIKKQLVWNDAISAAQYKLHVIDNMITHIESAHNSRPLSTMSEDDRARMLAQMICVEDIRIEKAIIDAIWL